MIEALARRTDPVESHDAAASVSDSVTQDRVAMLRAFARTPLSQSYREAALFAARDEGRGDTARIESLRRRGSDLKKLGWIEQSGRYDGQAIFRITDHGRATLLAASGV